MKYLKMLGLASVAAMALMAFFGASSASATVLCTTDAEPCKNTGWEIKTITASLTSGKSAVLKAAFSEVKCSNSHVHADIISSGGDEIEGEITELSFTECTCGARTAHVTVTSKGSLNVNLAGTAKSIGTRATINCTGLATCIFGTVAAGTDIGTVQDSTDISEGTPEVLASATLTWSSGTGDSGQFVCAGFGDTGTWTADYVLTNHESAYLTKS
jgi:hypothetical protein